MPTGPTERKELSSWKEVAFYLGVSIRTAQLWERDRGLPVRRLPGEKGRIWADPAALDRWRLNHRIAKPGWWLSPRFLRLWAATASGAVLVAGGLYLASAHRGPPARFHHEATSLVVTDERGRELWRRTFEQAFDPGSVAEKLTDRSRAWLGDIDGDGRRELLYIFTPATAEADGETLYCFSDTGGEKWRFVPGRELSTRAHRLARTYRQMRFFPLEPERDGTRRLAVKSTHAPHYPSQVVVLSHQGAVLGEYWHSGHIGATELADLDGDGRQEIVMTGISNGYGAATLLVLDTKELAGASAEENQDYQLLGFPPGREKARLLFPRTCINRKFDPYGIPAHLAVRDDSIEVAVREKSIVREPASLLVLYYFDRGLNLTNAVVSDPFRTYHREFEAAGQLDHPLTEKEISELRQIRYLKRLGP